MRTILRSRVAGAIVVALALIAAACSGDDSKEGPTITVGSTNFGEQEILGEIFATALEDAGYPVERKFQLGSREVVNPALKSGEIDLMAEYTGALLNFEGGTPSTDSDRTWNDLRAALEGSGVTALAYAPAEDKDGLAVTAQTAQDLGVSKISDLARYNGQLVFGGPPECPEREFCLLGYQDVYGLEFKEFRPLDTGGPITVAALEGGEIDVGALFTSDGVIAAKDFVLLEDDRNLHPAQNIVPVIRTEIVDEYGDDLTDLLESIAAAITTAELSEMNKQFGIDAVDADVLAAEWLETNGFGG